MRSFNVLIVGNGELSPFILQSKYLKKLYYASENKDKSDIKFITFKELAHKCKALEIDLVIVENTKFIEQGITDVLKTFYINCVAPNSQWVDVVLSNVKTKNILNRYNIKTPLNLSYPKEFPVIIKANKINKIAYTIQEVIDIKQNIFEYSPEIAKNIFLEEYINGESFEINTLFDGKNLILLSNPKINNVSTTLIKNYIKDLEFLLQNENYNFIGFVTSKLLLSNHKIYNTGFEINIPKPDTKIDLLYILIQALYQKLNETEIIH